VCLIAFKIADCIDNIAIPGQFTFPFSIALPDWLPSSMLICPVKEATLAGIKYVLAAEFIPIHPNNFANQSMMWSSYCYITKIFIFRP
jgi:hypothetical protein